MEFGTWRDRLGLGSTLWLAGALVAVGTATPVSAQTTLNLGRGFQPRFVNGTRYDSDSEQNVGQTSLIVNAFLDTDALGAILLTLEQSGRVLATGHCRSQWIPDTSLDHEAELWECGTERIDAATIRTSQPVDIVLATVNDVTDARSEIYRGTFPVIGFFDWQGNRDGHPVYVEQRALRLDSMYGVGHIRQYADQLEFSYVSTHPDEDAPREHQLRCRVGTGEWTDYETRLSRGNEQDLVNRVLAGDSVAEDGQTIVTQFWRFTVRMPIAIEGRGRTPSAGSSLDGAWTCEFRTGDASSRIVQRELRFEVLNGYIQHHAIESQIPAGRGAVLTAIGFDPAALPMIFDPDLVRGTVLGRRLTGATAPVVSGVPRARQPALVAPRGGRSRGRRS